MSKSSNEIPKRIGVDFVDDKESGKMEWEIQDCQLVASVLQTKPTQELGRQSRGSLELAKVRTEQANHLQQPHKRKPSLFFGFILRL